MGFKQRERNRRRNAAQLLSQRASRRTRSAEDVFWLTLATQKTCCSKCGKTISVGNQMVYRRTPRTILCFVCVDEVPEARGYKLSVRWVQARKKGRITS